ncbi:hypothetical protein ERJ75_000635700 [Trypanosoma vivax]|nr:hypothetical protein ERJ75_000635700 [Trypanosoma vivax]
MQRLFCTSAFFACCGIGGGAGSGSRTGKQRRRVCGAVRRLQEREGSKGRGGTMRHEIESFAAVGREENVLEEQGQRGTGEGIGPRTAVNEARTASPRKIAARLTKLAEGYAMQAVYGTEEVGSEEQKVPDAEDKTNAATHNAPRIGDHKRGL